jgi:hypothetical protein
MNAKTFHYRMLDLRQAYKVHPKNFSPAEFRNRIVAELQAPDPEDPDDASRPVIPVPQFFSGVKLLGDEEVARLEPAIFLAWNHWDLGPATYVIPESAVRAKFPKGIGAAHGVCFADDNDAEEDQFGIVIRLMPMLGMTRHRSARDFHGGHFLDDRTGPGTPSVPELEGLWQQWVNYSLVTPEQLNYRLTDLVSVHYVT